MSKEKKQKNRLLLFLANPIVALVFSITVAVTAILHPKSNKIFLIISAGMVFSALLYLLITKAVAYIQNRKWLSAHKYTIAVLNVDHEWRVSQDSTFNMSSVYSVRNIGKRSEDIIHFDNIGWFKKPEKYKMKCSFTKDNISGRLIKGARHSVYDGLYNLFRKNIYFISWSFVVNPPLQPNDEFTYKIEIITDKTELDAFSQEGSFAGFPANLPIESAKFRLIAPESYRFEIIRSKIVINNAGNEMLGEADQLEPVSLSPSKGLITWKLSKLKPSARYIFQYRLIKR